MAWLQSSKRGARDAQPRQSLWINSLDIMLLSALSVPQSPYVRRDTSKLRFLCVVPIYAHKAPLLSIIAQHSIVCGTL